MGGFPHWRRANIERLHLTSELGLAICAWSLVEDYLCDVLLAAVRPPDTTALIKAYYAVPNVDNKIRMVDAAVNRVLHDRPRILSAWGTLVNRMNRKRRLRNELAHRQVISNYQRSGVDVFLVPYFNLYDSDRLPGQATADKALPRLTILDVKQRSDGFEKLRHELQEFAKRLRGRRGKRRKAHSPAVVPRRGTPNARRRTPEGSRSPPQSSEA